jgi:hypothetical protein
MRLIDHGENLIPFATEIALSLKRLLSLFLALSYLALEYALNFFGGKRCAKVSRLCGRTFTLPAVRGWPLATAVGVSLLSLQKRSYFELASNSKCEIGICSVQCTTQTLSLQIRIQAIFSTAADGSNTTRTLTRNSVVTSSLDLLPRSRRHGSLFCRHGLAPRQYQRLSEIASDGGNAILFCDRPSVMT